MAGDIFCSPKIGRTIDEGGGRHRVGRGPGGMENEKGSIGGPTFSRQTFGHVCIILKRNSLISVEKESAERLLCLI